MPRFLFTSGRTDASRAAAAVICALIAAGVLLLSPGARQNAVAQQPTDTPTAPPGYAIERVAPPSQSVSTSQTSFSVDLTVENVTNLGAYDVLLTYDSAYMTFLSATDGPFLGSTGRTEGCQPPVLQPLGGTLIKLHYGCGTFNPPPPNGPSGAGTLATISFVPIAVGTVNLTLEPSLADPFGNTINAVAYSGTVDINTGPTPTPSETSTPTVTSTPCPNGICPTPTPVVCSPTTVAVEPQQINGHPGVVMDVPVVAHNACDVGGFQFTLTFDPSLLSFSSVQQGAFLGSTGRSVQCAAPEQDTGAVAVRCVTLGSPPPDGASGTGTLATVRLIPNDVGQSTLSLQDVILVTPDAVMLSASAVDGTAMIDACPTCVTVTATTTPTPVATATETLTPTETVTSTPCAGPCPTPVIATSTPTPVVVPANVSVDPTAISGQQGQAFHVPVRIDNAVNLGAFSFRLTWDASLLSFQSVTLGPFIGSTGRSPFCDTNTGDGPNTVVYSCSTLGASHGARVAQASSPSLISRPSAPEHLPSHCPISRS